jgi:hypothetical protein
MTIGEIIVRREQCGVSLVKTALLVAALLTGVAAEPLRPGTSAVASRTTGELQGQPARQPWAILTQDMHGYINEILLAAKHSGDPSMRHQP